MHVRGLQPVFGVSVVHNRRFRFMYARGLQPDGRSLYELYTVSIHACARIVTRQRVGTAHNGSRILIHACVKIATPLSGYRPYGSRCFDSCMCEDCNGDLCYRKIAIFILIHACARIATHKSPKEQTEYDILIHACARIATVEIRHTNQFL